MVYLQHSIIVVRRCGKIENTHAGGVMPSETREAAARYHRRALLETADRLLTAYGYDGMNMNLLAKEAGYSKATVYVYMESKEEIVRLLSIERLKLMRKELALVVKNDMSTEEKFAEIKSVFDEFYNEDRVYFDFICASAHADENGSDSERELSALVDGILADLTTLAPEPELRRRWYYYYGRIKTGGMFGA